MAVTIFPARAEALNCPAMPGADPSLYNIDADTRLEFIRGELRRSARHARIWTGVWGTLYGGLAVGNFIAAPFVSSHDRPGYLISGASAALGHGFVVFTPLKVMKDQKRLEKSIAASPSWGVERCALLAEAENYFARDAKNEAFGKGPLVMAGTIVYTVGVGLALGFGFDDWERAGIFIGSGIAVSAVQMGTQPGDLVPSLKLYQQGKFGPNFHAGRAMPRLIAASPYLLPGGAGFGIAGAF